MKNERLRRSIAIVGIGLVVLAVIFNFIYSGGNIIPGVDRGGRTSQVQDDYLRQQVIKAENYFKRGDKPNAVTTLEGLARKYPDNDRIHYLLGTYKLVDPVFDAEGAIKAAPLTLTNVDEALTHIKIAIELAPNNLSYKFSYALALAEIGRDKEAVPIFERLFADKKVRADLKLRYGVINYANSLVRLNMREKALDEYRKSLAVTNSDEQIAEQYKKLGRLGKTSFVNPWNRKIRESMIYGHRLPSSSVTENKIA